MRSNSDFWEIPRLWPNSTIFVIGGGPSLNSIDLSLIQDRRVIGVNQAYKLGQWVDVCWFGDKMWYDNNLPNIREYGGLIVTCSNPGAAKRKKRIKYVGRSKSSGIESKRRTHIGWNGNSGASAINLAYWLGATTVVLLGFDMQLPEDKRNGQTHWHNDYPKKVDKKTKLLDNPYPRFMKNWPDVARDAKRIGLKIINSTPGGALELFERKTLELVLEGIK